MVPKGSVVGIDFGTTNSTIARCIDPSSKVEIVRFPLFGGETESYRSLLYLERLRQDGKNRLISWTQLWAEHYDRGEAALTAIRRAVELDPLLALFHTYGAIYSLLLGRPDQAIESARRSLEVDPNFPPGIHSLGEACSFLGRHEEGAALIEETLAGVPPGYFYSALLAWVYVRSGRRQDAERLRATLEETAKVQYVPAGTRAFVAAALEDPESALPLLEEAVRERDPNVPIWIGSQYFQALHGSPRFDQLLRSMNLRR